MAVITLSKKGQIVIPKQIRQKYNLRQGDRFMVEDENGRIILHPMERYPLLQLRGVFKGKPRLTELLLQERRSEKAREDNKDV